MKKLLTVILCALSVSAFGGTEKAKKELEKAMLGDYQALRNVAYSMKDGSFGHDKNPVAACALRKVILIIHQDKVDVGDYGNEFVDCKALNQQESQQAWEIAIQALPIMMKYKK